MYPPPYIQTIAGRCLLPGVLVLRNIAQVAENQMSLSDSCRRLHNVRQVAG